jgi:putative ABC transport system permease protein
MTLFKIAWRNIEQRSLASFLTGLSMALGVSLVVAVLVASGVVGTSFRSGGGLGYNMIVGAKGGSLQLVLNTVYHLSKPVENIPYWYYQEFLQAAQRPDGRDGKFADVVEKAIPVLMGDYFGEYRVVATNTRMFDEMEFAPDRKYEFADGRNFKHDEFFTAVVGSQVARDAHVALGDEIQPSHAAPEGHKHDPFKVVGILKRTGTPADRAVFVNMEGFYLMGGHSRKVAPPPGASAPAAGGGTEIPLEAHVDVAHPEDLKPLPDDMREVTSLLVLTKSPKPGTPRELYVQGLIKEINKDFVAQAVAPIAEITRLFDTFVGPLTYLLFALAFLIVIVSGIGIMVSIYNSMSERRHEIAVMRALGAHRGKVMSIVLAESILLALAGGLCGWVLGHGLIAALAPWIEGSTGISVGFLKFAPQYELILIPGLIVLASVVGLLPALTAYRTDVAKALTATP